MKKIVPDPPHTLETHHALEDLLIQISEYLTCAVAITHQNTLLPIAVHTQALTLATMHEIEAARRLVEMALGKVQVRH